VNGKSLRAEAISFLGSFFWAALLTKAVATLFAVFGWFVAPIGWRYALLVWVYALAWFVINDSVKIWAYKILRRDKIIAYSRDSRGIQFFLCKHVSAIHS